MLQGDALFKIYSIQITLYSKILSLYYPGRGPPFSRLKTWCGFRSFLNDVIRLSPWQPPLFTFTNTSSGLEFSGIIWGYKQINKTITHLAFSSFLFVFSVSSSWVCPKSGDVSFEPLFISMIPTIDSTVKYFLFMSFIFCVYSQESNLTNSKSR